MREYIINQFENAGNNIKEMWKIINSLENFNQNCRSSEEEVSELLIGNSIVTESDKISKEFNNYFNSISKILADKIPAGQEVLAII